MNTKTIHLRALEPQDLPVLEQIENDTTYWKYSNQTEPFSLHLLQQYINQQQQDIFEVKQKRFVIADEQKNAFGFVDLFDFEPLHRRLGVGLFVRAEFRNKGVGKQALGLLNRYAEKQLNIKSMYANIAIENTPSIRLFESLGYRKVGHKKDWNFYDGIFHDEFLYQKQLS